MKQQTLSLVQRRRIWLFVVLLASILLPYLFFCPCLNDQFISQILFHPTKLPGREAGLERIAGVAGEEVFFSYLQKTENPQLNGWLYSRPDSKLLVVFNHGNTGNILTRKWKLESLLLSGASVFVYDYQGFGRSDGHPNVSGVIEDSVAALDYLIDVKGYDAKNIVLYGESLGSCISIELARRRHYRGIILQSGCMSAESLCKEQVPFLNIYPSALFFKPRLDNMEYLSGDHPPVLIVVGKLDELIPIKHSLMMFEKASDPKRLVILPNSRHNDFQRDLDSFQNALRSFFESLETDKFRPADKTKSFDEAKKG